MTFKGTDKRGLPIFFPQKRWDHAKPHFTVVKGTWKTVMSHWELSPLVIDNEPHDEATLGPQRVSHERYVCLVPEWKQYLIVPTIILPEEKSFEGQTLVAGTRVAWTAMTELEIRAL